MATKLFSVLYVARLRIGDLFSLVKSTLDIARPLVTVSGGILQATFTQLETDNNLMGDQMDKPARNSLTHEVDEKDDDRDNRFSEIKRNVSLNLKSSNSTKKAAAENLKLFFEPYWNAAYRALNTETGMFTELFERYNADADLQANAATIGIGQMMTDLETSNTSFDAIYKQRNASEAARGPSATSLKSATVKGYEQFCTAVEQAVSFAPTPELETLFKEMDELRKTYARLIANGENEEQG